MKKEQAVNKQKTTKDSQLLLPRIKILPGVGKSQSDPDQWATIQIYLVIHSFYLSGFVEFKAESDFRDHFSGGEVATGHLTQKLVYTLKQPWGMGPWDINNNIWMWWDTFKAQADMTVVVNGITVFDGYCDGNMNNEASLISTCKSPRIYKTTGDIHLVEDRKKKITYIRKTFQ